MINNNEKELNNLYYSDTDSVNQKPKSDWRTGDRTIFKRKGSNSEKKNNGGKSNHINYNPSHTDNGGNNESFVNRTQNYIDYNNIGYKTEQNYVNYQTNLNNNPNIYQNQNQEYFSKPIQKIQQNKLNNSNLDSNLFFFKKKNIRII